MNIYESIRINGNKDVPKLLANIDLEIFNKKFETIYNNYIIMLNKCIEESKYKVLITKLSYECMKRLFKNLVLEFIRNNEHILYDHIKNKYPNIKFHCLDTYNYYYNKKEKKKYVFCYENNKFITYKLTKNNYIKTNLKVPFPHKLSNEEHTKGCDRFKYTDILTFIDDLNIFGSDSSNKITLYNTCLNTTYDTLFKYTQDNNIHHIFLSQYNIQEIGHANAIIIDNNKKKIIRLESLVNEPINNIGVLINKLINNTNYEYISINNIFNIKKGLQETSQTGHWCTIWSYYLSLLYYDNQYKFKKLITMLIKLDDYNTNFMFYYIYNIFYNKVITQKLMNNLFDQVLKTLNSLKHINNEEFIYVLQNLTDYTGLPKIVDIFNGTYTIETNKLFMKKIYEYFDRNSLKKVKKILKSYIKKQN